MIANEIYWTKCVRVSTDGARAMPGKFTGLIARIQKIIPSVTWHHFCETIVSKKIPISLKTVLDETVKNCELYKGKIIGFKNF